MTVQSTTRRAGPFNGNGIATQFPFDFKIFQASDIRVVRTTALGVEEDMVLSSDYTVSINLDQDADPGGTVTYPAVGGPAVLPTGWKLTVIGAMEMDQLTDITNVGRFNPDVTERAFDKSVILIQQLAERVDRAVQVPVSSSTSPENLIDDLVAAGAVAAAAASAASASAGSASTAAGSAATSAAAAAGSVTAAGAAATTATGAASAAAASAALAATDGATAGAAAATTQVNSFKTSLAAQTGAAGTGALLSGFKFTAGNSTGRTLQEKLDDVANAKDWGLKTTNTGAQNRQALADAVSWANSVGGATIYVPRGTYDIAGTVDVTANNIRIVGDGANATIFNQTSATAPTFSTSAATIYQSFEDFGITHSVTRNSGADTMYFNMARRSFFKRLRITRHSNGINFYGFEVVTVQDCFIVDPSFAGIAVLAGHSASFGTNTGANLTLLNLFQRGGSDLTVTGIPVAGTYGCVIYDIEAVWMIGCDFSVNEQNSVQVQPNWLAANCYFQQTFFDATKLGHNFLMTGAGVKRNFSFSNCWFSGGGTLPSGDANACGFVATNNGSYETFQLDGCRFFSNKGAGVLLLAPYIDMHFSGCRIELNGAGASTYRHGAVISPATTQTGGMGFAACKFAGNNLGSIRYDNTCRSNLLTGNNIQDAINCADAATFTSAAGNGNSAVVQSYSTASVLGVDPTAEWLSLAGPTTLNELKPRYKGQRITIYCQSNFTLAYGTGSGQFVTNSGANVSLTAGQRISFINNDNWHQA